MLSVAKVSSAHRKSYSHCCGCKATTRDQPSNPVSVVFSVVAACLDGSTSSYSFRGIVEWRLIQQGIPLIRSGDVQY